MEISNLPNKKLKVMVMKMLTKFGRRMDEHNHLEFQQTDRKYKKEPRRANEYNDKHEKYTRKNQQQVR